MIADFSATPAQPIPCSACRVYNLPSARFCSQCGNPFPRIGEAEAASPAVADPLIGRVIADRYRILSVIGRGGMGVVYKVEHTHIGKFMAMKLLHGELATNRETLKRFRREAEAASRLDHPNTVQIFDFGQSDGLTYLVMQYLEGFDFSQVIDRENPIAFSRIARICAQVCASVSQAHEKGIIHRDLKPENVMILRNQNDADFVKVLDFGLAKLRDVEDYGAMTKTGLVLGTPYYMAPEQIRGEAVDQRADIYAIGAMMYKACVGVPPFWAATPVAILTKHLTEPVIPPSEKSGRQDLAHAADRIILRALEKNADHRYQNAESLQRDLLNYLVSEGDRWSVASLEASGSGRVLDQTDSRFLHQRSATRGEVDRYERGIRTRGSIGYTLMGLLMLSVVGAGWWAFNKYGLHKTSNAEIEPNNAPANATLLPEGKTFLAYLGKRMSPQLSDADVYRLENPKRLSQPMSLGVSGIPNMDIVVDIARVGTPQPLLEVNAGGVGAPELIPNAPFSGSAYLVRVRERWLDGTIPTENVSDPYKIQWRFVAPQPNDEHEFNDTFASAENLPLGTTMRAWIGWPGDIDYYCVDRADTAFDMHLNGVAGMDLRVRMLDPTTDTSVTIDDHGVDKGEERKALTFTATTKTCFEISSKPEPEGKPVSVPAIAYTFSLTKSSP